MEQWEATCSKAQGGDERGQREILKRFVFVAKGGNGN